MTDNQDQKVQKGNGTELIIESLSEKASLKQQIYRQTLEIFDKFKETLATMQTDLGDRMAKIDENVEIAYTDKGTFEAEFKFSGDVLIFNMHSNVFNFDTNHFLHTSKYIESDQSRSYCGMIEIYNFLADSFKYGRYKDVGYLIARIFINKDKHFFVEGKRQLGFLYNDFEKMVLDDQNIKNIIESAILYAIDFELLVPPYDEVKELSVGQKIEQGGSAAIKTGKRLGFRFQADSDRVH